MEQVVCSVICTPHGFKPRIPQSTQSSLTILLRISDALDDTVKTSLRQLYANLPSGSDLEETFSSEEVAKLFDELQRICDDTKNSNRTSKLWIEYLELVQIMRLFVHAKKTGDWHLHLYMVK